MYVYHCVCVVKEVSSSQEAIYMYYYHDVKADNIYGCYKSFPDISYSDFYWSYMITSTFAFTHFLVNYNVYVYVIISNFTHFLSLILNFISYYANHLKLPHINVTVDAIQSLIFESTFMWWQNKIHYIILPLLKL